jgi:hypothetical protein
VPAAQFRGELVRVNQSEKRFTLRLRQAIIVQSPYHTWQIAHVQRRLILDQQIRNPRNRLLAIQDHLLALAYHQARLYRRHDQHQDLVVQAAAGVQVRSLQKPAGYDDKGNPRDPQKPDPKLPGYPAEFAALRPGSVVDVYLARVDAARLPEGIKEGAPLEAVSIVIQVAAP